MLWIFKTRLLNGCRCSKKSFFDTCKKVYIFIVLVLISGCATPKHPHQPKVEIFNFRAAAPKKEILSEIKTSYKNICLLLEGERSEVHEHDEIKDVILTELYFSPLFHKISDIEELEGKSRWILKGKMPSLEVVRSAASSIDSDAFLYVVVNKNIEHIKSEGKRDFKKQFLWDFKSLLGLAKKTEPGKIVELDITFSLLDSRSGKNVWSKRATTTKQTVKSRFMIVKETVKKVVKQFENELEEIKGNTGSVSRYPLENVANILRSVSAKAQNKKNEIEALKKKKEFEALKEKKEKTAKQKKKPIKIIKKNIEIKEKKTTKPVKSSYRLKLPPDTKPSKPLNKVVPTHSKSHGDNFFDKNFMDAVIMPTNMVKETSVEKKEFVKEEIRKIMSKFGETNFKVSKDFVKEVKLYMSKWKKGRKSNFNKLMARGKKNNYFKISRNILVKYNLPEELVYVALYESGFNPKAVSSAGAVGLWQMMAPTAYRYKLCDNRKCRGRDDRTDPLKSTLAAAEHMSNLLAEFGGPSVMLAMAAYNMGENGLRRSLRKLKNPIRDRNFWHLYKNRLIPRETRKYVLRIISAIILGEEFNKK